MQQVLAAIRHFVQQQPDYIAVAEYDDSLSYAALNNCTDYLARQLLSGNRTSGSVVGYLGSVNIDLVVTLLAAHKAGFPFIFLDASLPKAALIDVITHADISVLVTRSIHKPRGQELLIDSDMQLLVADDIRTNSSLNDPFTERAVDEDALSHIRYTSGSTGRPKGVPLSRRHVARMLAVFDQVLEPRTSDRFGLFGHFWPLVIFRALSVGACVDCFDFPRKGAIALNAWMIERRISVMFTYPIVFRQMMSASNEALPDLRFIHLSGEPVLREDITLFESRCADHTCLHNSYGSSEYPWIAGYFHQHGDHLKYDVVPLGLPVAPAMVHLLDNQGQPVATNEIGEIIVVSEFLPTGYYRDPDRSANVFRSEPALSSATCYHTGDLGYFDNNGLLHGAGRSDQQIKIRGYIVDPGDIERTLSRHPAIESAAVVPFPGPRGDDRLACHYSTHDGTPILIAELREFLSDRLPRQLLPVVFQNHLSLPLTITGKLDRNALSAYLPDSSAKGVISSVNEMENTLIQIWTELLGHNNFDRYDDFFSVGGDSLQAMNMLVAIEKYFSRRLTLEIASIEGASIHTLMELLRLNSPPDRFVYLRRSGSRSPLFLTHLKGGHFSDYLPVIEQLGVEQPVIGLYPQGMVPGTPGDASIETAAEFCNRELRNHIDPMNASIAGYSFGALVAFAMTQQLHQAKEPIKQLILIDPPVNFADPLRLLKLVGLPLRTGEWSVVRHRLLHALPFLLGITKAPQVIDDAHLVASLAYQPHSLGIPDTLLMLAADNPRRLSIEKQWRYLLGEQVTVVTLPGNHRSLMQAPYAKHVAEQILRALDVG